MEENFCDTPIGQAAVLLATCWTVIGFGSFDAQTLVEFHFTYEAALPAGRRQLGKRVTRGRKEIITCEDYSKRVPGPTSAYNDAPLETTALKARSKPRYV
ncbi:hypothetical protein KM043_013623 [Ampulex compressa]|nr:hypothetical protein KM043_013623 [Ampulex compressa]